MMSESKPNSVAGSGTNQHREPGCPRLEREDYEPPRILEEVVLSQISLACAIKSHNPLDPEFS